jgi:hypothetical protein
MTYLVGSGFGSLLSALLGCGTMAIPMGSAWLWYQLGWLVGFDSLGLALVQYQFVAIGSARLGLGNAWAGYDY